MSALERLRQRFRTVKSHNITHTSSVPIQDESLFGDIFNLGSLAELLSPNQPLASRIECIIELAKVADNMAFTAEIPLLWEYVSPLLLEENMPKEARMAALTFMKATAESIDRLRLPYLRALKEGTHVEDIPMKLKVIKALTKDGRDIAGFEDEIVKIILSWIKATIHSQPSKESSQSLNKPSPADVVITPGSSSNLNTKSLPSSPSAPPPAISWKGGLKHRRSISKGTTTTNTRTSPTITPHEISDKQNPINEQIGIIHEHQHDLSFQELNLTEKDSSISNRILQFAANLMKFNFFQMNEFQIESMIHYLSQCIMNRESYPNLNIDTILNLFDVIARYGSVPTPVLKDYVSSLCIFGHESPLAFSIIQNLLKGHYAGFTTSILCDLVNSDNIMLAKNTISCIGLHYWSTKRVSTLPRSDVALLSYLKKASLKKSNLINIQLLIALQHLLTSTENQFHSLEFSVILEIMESLKISLEKTNLKQKMTALQLQFGRPVKNLVDNVAFNNDDLNQLLLQYNLVLISLLQICQSQILMSPERKGLASLLMPFGRLLGPEAEDFVINEFNETIIPAFPNWISILEKLVQYFFLNDYPSDSSISKIQSLIMSGWQNAQDHEKSEFWSKITEPVLVRCRIDGKLWMVAFNLIKVLAEDLLEDIKFVNIIHFLTKTALNISLANDIHVETTNIAPYSLRIPPTSLASNTISIVGSGPLSLEQQTASITLLIELLLHSLSLGRKNSLIIFDQLLLISSTISSRNLVRKIALDFFFSCRKTSSQQIHFVDFDHTSSRPEYQKVLMAQFLLIYVLLFII